MARPDYAVTRDTLLTTPEGAVEALEKADSVEPEVKALEAMSNEEIEQEFTKVRAEIEQVEAEQGDP